MKLTKKNNPFGVKTGSVWKRKKTTRPNKFKVTGFTGLADDPYAEVLYPKTGKQTLVRLDRFNEYAAC